MKKFLCFVLLLVSVCAAQPVRAQGLGPVIYQSAGTNFVKCGWDELFNLHTNVCPPLNRYYKQIEQKTFWNCSWGGLDTNNNFDPYRTGYAHYDEIGTLDTNCSEVYSSTGNFKVTYSETNGFDGINLGYALGWAVTNFDGTPNGEGWTDGFENFGSFERTFNGNGWDFIGYLNPGEAFDREVGWWYWDYSAQTFTPGDSPQLYAESRQTIPSSTGNGLATNSTLTILSTEYPTSALLQPVIAHTNWESGTPSSSFAMLSDQSGDSMTGSRIKFGLQAPPGQEFTIPYVIHVHLDEVGTNDTPGMTVAPVNFYATNTITGRGDGTYQYYPSGKGLQLRPPYTKVNNGCADLYYGGTAELSLLDWIYLPDGHDRPCNPGAVTCASCGQEGGDPAINPQSIAPGMPVWWVSEPYVNLWVSDKPVEYATSLGEKIAFTLTYKQHDTRPNRINGRKPFLPINGWNNSWYSYVHFQGETLTNADGSFQAFGFDNWTATVYEPNGGESAYTAGQAADANTGDRLLPMDGTAANVPGRGFRLVHPDGSQDLYGLVSPYYPTNYVEEVPVMQDFTDTTLPVREVPYGIIYSGNDYEPIWPQRVGTSAAGIGGFDHPATNYVVRDANWTDIVHSISNRVPVTIVTGPSADALLTEHIDPQGHSIRFFYGGTNDAYQLQSVVDYDGKTTTIGYDTNGYIATVSMPYGRTAQFQYEPNTNAQLAMVTDAQGLPSWFTYFSQDGYLTHLRTLYGDTGFIYYESNATSSAKSPAGLTRAIRINRPDTTSEMYALFASVTNGIPFSYSGDEVPEVPSNVQLSNGATDYPRSAMYLRNSFHWGPKQFEQLSRKNPADLGQLTAADVRLGRMTHWKLSTDGLSISGAISLTQEPSPDGATPGQKVWYGGGWQVGSDEKPTSQWRLMPDGTTWFEILAYNPLGLLSSIIQSWADPAGSIFQRNLVTYTYSYAHYGQSIDNATNTWDAFWLTGVAGPGFSRSFSTGPDDIVTSLRPNFYGSNVLVADYYPHYRQAVLSDLAGASSTFYFNDRSQIAGVSTSTGLTTTNFFGTDGFLSGSIALEIHATNTYTFTNGLLATRLDPAGLSTSYDWDYLNRLTAIHYPDGTTQSNVYYRLDLTDHKDRLGYWTHASFDSLRRLRNFTDHNNQTTTLDYCACGGLDSITDPQTNITRFTRNLVGWVDKLTFIGADGSQTTRSFGRDALGRTTNVTESSGLNLNYSLNIQGLVTAIHSATNTLFAATYDTADRPLTQCDASGHWVTNNYNAAGQLQDQYFASDLSRHFSYVGWLRTSATDFAGQVTSFGYDAAGRMTSTADAGSIHVNGFAYNPAGQLVALTDGNGNVTQWGYDKYGNQISHTNGQRVLIETNGYDVNGRLIAHWTPAKGLTHYSHDPNGNLLTVAFSSGPGTTATYDSLNRIKTLVDGVGSTAFSYQGFGAFMGALASEDGPWDSDTVTHTYSERLPQSLALTQPGESPWSESFTHDALLRLQTLTSPAGTFTYHYTGAGSQVQSLLLSNGNQIANSYDDAGQLLSTTLSHDSSVLDTATYTYNGTGRRQSVLRTDGSHVDFGYDNLGQLLSAVGQESGGILRGNEDLGYGYDLAGNLVARTNHTLIQSFTPDNANALVNITRNNDLLTVAGSVNQLTTNLTINGEPATFYSDKTFAVTNGVAITNGLNILTAVVNGTMTNRTRELLPESVTLRNDPNGNLIWDGMKAYDYDCANQLTRVTVTNAVKIEYAYDGFGRRRIRQEYHWSAGGWTNTSETRYVYDGMTVLQERDGNNHPLVTYTRGLDLSGTSQGAGGIGGLLARSDTNGHAFYHADGNGNITMLISTDGTKLAQYLYDSFGNPLGMWGTLAAANTYRFSSKELDRSIGLYYFGYRYYEPNFQRWLNPDPIGEAGGLNLYGYVGNDPINKVDPLGLEANPIMSTISGISGAWNYDPYGSGGSFYGPGLFGGPPPYRFPTIDINNPAALLNDGGIADLSQDFFDASTLIAGGLLKNAFENFAVKRCATRAADTGANIALGSRYSGLRTFASNIGVDHLLDEPNNKWKDAFPSHVDNPSTTFHVNMGGFFGDTPSEMILNEMRSGSHTGWELQQLQQAGRLPEVNFYQPGNLTPIPNPFIK